MYSQSVVETQYRAIQLWSIVLNKVDKWKNYEGDAYIDHKQAITLLAKYLRYHIFKQSQIGILIADSVALWLVL